VGDPWDSWLRLQYSMADYWSGEELKIDDKVYLAVRPWLWQTLLPAAVLDPSGQAISREAKAEQSRLRAAILALRDLCDSI
jgi:hypothetical protein